jgi:two-component system chemotaxis response regulator CheB
LQPNSKTRVLLVDDAVVVRKALSNAIALDPDLEVAATAVNGRVALAKFGTVKPDIVLLDIEMPGMDGLETVRELRKIDSGVPIIMFSTLTERGASVTLEALALGATDYVAKPGNGNGAASFKTVTAELIPKIRALCHLPALRGNSLPESKAFASPRLPPAARILPPVHIAVIGVSTGGPDALAQLLPSLPAKLPIPILIAQHMPPAFTSMLASRLSSQSKLTVRECVSGEAISPGCALIAPGDFHMAVKQDGVIPCIETHQGPKENFCRPSVDVLFRSVAAVYGARTLAIVLTGMGQDGLKGCEALRRQGARIYVQDEATSVVWGMPGFVARAGLADKVLALDQIAAEIVQATTMPNALRSQS